tara:strand:- start:289 stop:444 length:156 start_codon:yes stop_codon:yes gene_type:complete
MKKLSILFILTMAISSSVFACGEVSDVSASEISEPVITSTQEAEVPAVIVE